MKRSKNKLSKDNFKDKKIFFKTEIRAYSKVWRDNVMYLQKFYDVHSWAWNLTGKGVFLMKIPRLLYARKSKIS